MPATVTDRLNGLTTSVAVKAPCRAATTANITLSGAQTIDGIAVVAGDRVLVKNQTTTSQNGIYVVASGAWVRATDFDGSLDVVGGSQISVVSGTANAGSYWRVSGYDTTVAVGTDSISIEAGLLSSTASVSYIEGSASAISETLQTVLRRTPVNVMSAIPANLHASIADGTVTTTLVSYFNEVAAYAVANDRPMYIPAGTFTMQQWLPPANLVVLTAGYDTIFKQLDTSGVGTRFIDVQADNVRLWPGGAVTINGGMTAGGVNATSFNSGVRVHAPASVTINRFACGDIYGLNIGGDVIETGAAATGTLKHCRIGTIYADNVYRNGISITAGETGLIDGMIQIGGIGFVGVDFEPDAASGSPPANWWVGPIRTHRVNVSGDAAKVIGAVTLSHVDMDYTRAVSTPVFNYGGVSAVLTPNAFERGMQYRNVKSLRIDHWKINSFPRGAIVDVGEAGGDSPAEHVHIGYLELASNGATSDYEISIQKTELFEIDFLRDTSKVAATDATFVSGQAIGHIKVNAGAIKGIVCSTIAGSLALGADAIVEIDGDAQAIFRNVTGQLTLDSCVITDTATLFDTCSLVPIVRACTITATTLLTATTNAHFWRSTVNSVFYADQLATVINAQVGTTYTLVAADLGKLITCTNAGAITLTVPANATVAFPIGAEVRIMQGGAGAVTVATGGTPTLRSRGALLATNGQYAKVNLTKIATDEWLVDGDRA